MSHNKNEVILLPYDHRFSRLYAEHIHRQGHLGVLSTSSKIRKKFWIIKLLKMVKSIPYNCMTCKKLDKRLSQQIMGKLPVERKKRAITAAISDHVLTFSELQTVCFEAANLLNEKPIRRHPTSPHDGTYLCPNDLLLGRATSRVPSRAFRETSDFRRRFEFIQSIVSYFWKKWTRDYFLSLLIQPKWHTAQRNLCEGDVVLIQDVNQIKGQWKLGTVLKAFPGGEVRVRKVQGQDKNPKPGEAVNEYHDQCVGILRQSLSVCCAALKSPQKGETYINTYFI